MLRATICNNTGELRLRLEGRLTGPWVLEAESCWKAALSSAAGQTVTVDLRDVDFVDSAGEELLCTMHRQGARLVAAGAMMGHLVGEIAQPPDAAAGTVSANVNKGAAVPVCYRKKK
jgi:ABC-type transporter Mla MlaB component